MRFLSLNVLLFVVACGRSPGVAPPPEPQLDRIELTFVVTSREVPIAQLVTVSTGPVALVPWRAAADRPWLRVGPAAGVTPAVVSISVDEAGLAPGEYTGLVVFEFGDEGRAHALREVVVRLSVVAPNWSLTSGPFGGAVSALSARGERVLAGDPYGTVWLSTDGGQSFSATASLGGALGSLALGAELTYASSDTTGVWRSRDGGSSWERTALTGDVAQIVARSETETLVYARNANASVVSRSADAGDTWTNVPLNGRAFCLALSGIPSELFVCGDNWSADRTLTDGQSWTNFPSTALFTKVMLRSSTDPALILAGGQDGTLARSTDDGVTWSRAVLGVPFGTARDLQQLDGAYWLASTAGLATSSDGVVFTSASTRPLPHAEFTRLAHTGTTLLAGHAALGVLRDASALMPATGIFAHRVQSISVDPLDGRVLVATDRTGVWELAVDAAWAPVAAPILFPGGATSTSRLLLRDPADRARLLLATCPGGVFASSDAGTSWSRGGANAGDCVRGLAWDFDDPQVAYAFNGRNLMRSDDRGVTFELMRTFDGDVRALMSLPGGDLVLFHWYYAALRWRAATATWEPLGNVGDFTHTAVHADGTALIAGPTGVYALDDIGLRLVAPSSTLPTSGLVLHDDEVFFARYGAGLQHSRDRGATWDDTGCPSLLITALAIDPARHVLWVATADLGVLSWSLD